MIGPRRAASVVLFVLTAAGNAVPADGELTPYSLGSASDAQAQRAATVANHDAGASPPASRWTLGQPQSSSSQDPILTAQSISPLYQGWIITLLVLVGLQFALIVALLIQSLRRRADRMALAETMQRFRLAGLAGQVGIWEWDLDSDKMIIEPHSRSLLGYDATQENARTADWRTHIHQEDLPKVIQAAHDHAHGLTPQFEIQHRMMDNGRNVRWFLSRGQAQRRGHHPTRMIGSSIDITDRKLAEDERLRAQEALQEKQAELAHLSRAATIGALSVALAHEINQPLSAILTNAQTAQRLLENAALDERELDEIMLDIEKDGRRAGEVIQKLRNLLRRGEGDFNLIQIGSVVDDVLHLLHSELVDRRVTVVRATTSEPDSIFGDTIQLQQVLLNLLNNATDAMSGLEPSARKIAISIGRTKTGGIRISVSDCGSGLSAEDRVRLFQPFFTTKRNGLGLGLSISKSIVEAHAGKLWAENNRNGGATFHIELPAAPQAQIG